MTDTQTLKVYRKNPIEVNAIQWTGENFEEIEAFTNGTAKLMRPAMKGLDTAPPLGPAWLLIPTLEGPMHAYPGYWIIRGIKGEFYPCKPDIFKASYTEVTVVHPGTDVAVGTKTYEQEGYEWGQLWANPYAFASLPNWRELVLEWAEKLTTEVIANVETRIEQEA